MILLFGKLRGQSQITCWGDYRSIEIANHQAKMLELSEWFLVQSLYYFI